MSDIVYYLSEYNWESGTLIKRGKVNTKVKDRFGNERCIKNEKIACADELVCIVWEQWKGKNGRGGYRIERQLYPNQRLPANKIPRQDGTGRVWEISLGIRNPNQP